MHTVLRFWDKFWRDTSGNVVIWQTPNLWLIGWVILTTISLFISGAGSDVFSLVGEGSLVIWALLEIFKGANYFRRLLGLIVLAFAITVAVKNFL